MVEADLSSAQDLELPPVEVVVHAAATISYTGPIHDAIATNYTVRRALQGLSASGLAGSSGWAWAPHAYRGLSASWLAGRPGPACCSLLRGCRRLGAELDVDRK